MYNKNRLLLNSFKSISSTFGSGLVEGGGGVIVNGGCGGGVFSFSGKSKGLCNSSKYNSLYKLIILTFSSNILDFNKFNGTSFVNISLSDNESIDLANPNHPTANFKDFMKTLNYLQI